MNRTFKKFAAAAIAPVILGAGAALYAGDLVLWYQQPVGSAVIGTAPPFINEALPIGNGRLGGLIAGGTAREQVVLNEDSLWTGDENPSGNDGTMGAYQCLGNLYFNLSGHENLADYRRDLDIGNALAHVSYQSGGVNYRREYFCSQPDGVLVVRLTADRPGSYTGSIELSDAHGTPTVAGKNHLTFAGALNNGLKYEAQLIAVPDGGTLQTHGTTLEFKNCSSLTLNVAAGTDYAMDYAAKYRGEDPHARVTKQVEKASAKNYDALKATH
jgi:alpha-L-fucosidase 2